ncbi:carbohydrate-binding protein [Corynebacterium hindlerae]|uniref:carbohydrate-binding protein n=1 Tax=Corynebacterium hindlerae TaxID=699041 RepID=UPI0038B22DFF
MAELKVGGVTPSKIFYGSTPVTAVYYGTRKIWPPAPKYPEWSEGGDYAVGDIVTYNGRYYQLITRLSSWRRGIPPDSSFNWQEVPPGSTSTSPGDRWAW